MTTPPPEPDDPLIPRKWGPYLSAAATIAASVLIWLVQVAGNVDQRIKALEVVKGHIVDEGGNIRPSSTAQANKERIAALEARLELLQKKLGL